MTLYNRQVDEVGLAVVPGGALGDDRCIRLSCAASPAIIEDGVERLQHFGASL
jgi:aspartate aminotransferase